ncbi:MAG: right-handed parallel beta-helix repeat-containing protein [Acidobacteriota bacterium]
MLSSRILKPTIAALIGLMSAGAALAVDGVFEINAAAAAAGDVTDGDTPGFPITLSSPGSYRLTGGLKTGNPDATLIEVTVPDVSLDLNGFTLEGPGLAGSGVGITSTSSLTVFNGTIRGMGGFGISASAIGNRIENVHFRANLGGGLAVSSSSIVRHCAFSNNGNIGLFAGSGNLLIGNTANDNADRGIEAGSISVIRDNLAWQNDGDGIFSGSSAVVIGNSAFDNTGDGIATGNVTLVKDNTLRGNDSVGLDLTPRSGYVGNVITALSSSAVSGGVELGVNFCGLNTTCP